MTIDWQPWSIEALDVRRVVGRALCLAEERLVAGRCRVVEALLGEVVEALVAEAAGVECDARGVQSMVSARSDGDGGAARSAPRWPAADGGHAGSRRRRARRSEQAADDEGRGRAERQQPHRAAQGELLLIWPRHDDGPRPSVSEDTLSTGRRRLIWRRPNSGGTMTPEDRARTIAYLDLAGASRTRRRRSTTRASASSSPTARRIAVIGASDDPGRPSHDVFQHMLASGFDAVPVNPNAPLVAGVPAYPDACRSRGGDRAVRHRRRLPPTRVLCGARARGGRRRCALPVAPARDRRLGGCPDRARGRPRPSSWIDACPSSGVASAAARTSTEGA